MKHLSFFKGIIIPFMLILILLLNACSSNSGAAVDYGDAAAFEEALGRGENLENKTVMITVTELHPESVLGFNVCAGEHLNFISSKNPGLKVGDTVGVKATDISNLLGSWIIKYEIVKNAVIGEKSIISEGSASGNPAVQTDAVNNALPESTTPADLTDSGNGDHLDSDIRENSETDNPKAEMENNSAATSGVEGAENDDNTSNTDASPALIEYVDSRILVFNDYFGSPAASAYVAFRNTGEDCIRLTDTRIDYQDKDGKLLATDQYPNCIPETVKPGQTGYLYSYYFDISDIDTSNGLTFVPGGTINNVSGFYEIEVSDVSFKTDDYLDIKIIGKGTNNSGKAQYAEPGAVFFDKDNNVVGFCYGLENFEEGQTRSFEISGDVMSEDIDPASVDHVEVYIQGASYF